MTDNIVTIAIISAVQAIAIAWLNKKGSDRSIKQREDIAVVKATADQIEGKADVIHSLTNGTNSNLTRANDVLVEKVAGLERTLASLIDSKVGATGPVGPTGPQGAPGPKGKLFGG